MFWTHKKAQEEISRLSALNETLEADHTAAQQEVERLQAENVALSEKAAQVETLTSELEEASNKLNEATAKLATFDEKVKAAALAQFESLGGQPAPAAQADESAGKSAYDQYRELQKNDPAAATEFWNANLAPKA